MSSIFKNALMEEGIMHLFYCFLKDAAPGMLSTSNFIERIVLYERPGDFVSVLGTYIFYVC